MLVVFYPASVHLPVTESWCVGLESCAGEWKESRLVPERRKVSRDSNMRLSQEPRMEIVPTPLENKQAVASSVARTGHEEDTLCLISGFSFKLLL